MNTKYIGALIGIVIIGGGCFYAGIVYAKSHAAGRPAGQFAGGQFTGRGARAGGLIAGSIIAKDATSITIKMQDGSTKIVILATSTPVMKATSGTAADLTTGTDVAVTGQTNADGSVTASSIQIRPQGFGVRPNTP